MDEITLRAPKVLLHIQYSEIAPSLNTTIFNGTHGKLR